jgi:hypothetical protein
MHHHKWSLSDLDNLVPWEKAVYVDMLVGHLKKEEERYKKQQQQTQGRTSL